MSLRVTALIAFILLFAAPARAQQLEGEYLYQVTTLRADVGKLSELLDWIAEMNTSSYSEDAADRPPFVMRHSQGDQWDLMIITPTSFLIHLTSAFEICDGCPASDYPAQDDRRWRAASPYSLPVDSVSPWFRVRPGEIYRVKYEYTRNGRAYSDKTALDPAYHAEGTEVDGVHVDWAYLFFLR